MQDAVLPVRTVSQEVMQGIESEGHARVCGLFVSYKGSTCRTKDQKSCDQDHPRIEPEEPQ
jgi:hypothetical protein